MEMVVDTQINRALTWPSIWYCPLFSYGVVTAFDLYVLFCGLFETMFCCAVLAVLKYTL